MPGPASRRKGMTTTILSVEGMTCGSCAAHVEACLTLPGVDHVDVGLAVVSVASTHVPSVNGVAPGTIVGTAPPMQHVFEIVEAMSRRLLTLGDGRVAITTRPWCATQQLSLNSRDA